MKKLTNNLVLAAVVCGLSGSSLIAQISKKQAVDYERSSALTILSKKPAISPAVSAPAEPVSGKKSKQAKKMKHRKASTLKQDNRVLSKENNKLKRENNKLTTQDNRKTQQIAQLKTDLSKVRSDLNGLKKENKQLTSENRRFKQQNKNLEKANKRLEKKGSKNGR